MSTSDLTRTWCEIETLVEGIAPLIQEVVTGDGTTYEQYSAEARSRLQRVVALTRRARQISGNLQRISIENSARAAQKPTANHGLDPLTASQSAQPIRSVHLAAVNMQSQGLAQPPAIQPGIQYRVVDGKVPGISAQHGICWPQRSVVVDQLGQQIGMHGAVPISTSQEPSEPVAVYNLTEHHILPLSLAEQKNIDWDRIS